MLAVIKNKPEPGVSVKDVPQPKPREGEVLVKILYASICGTDVGIYDWTPWAAKHISPPTIIGHEIVGEILEINGNAKHLSVGDIVSSETHIFDDTCYQCQSNRRHICEHVQLFGIGRDGGFAEYATIPVKTTWKNEAAISVKEMSIQEPLGNAVNAVSKAHVTGRRVLIMGLGPTGLCAAGVAKAYGAGTIVAIDPQPYRRDLLKKFTGIEAEEAYSTDMNDYFDIVLEMSGNSTAIKQSFDAVRIAGSIIAFGIPKSTVEIDWGGKIIDKEIYIKSVFGRKIWQTWHQTTDLLNSGELKLADIITHEFELKDFEEAMHVMKSGESGKIVLKVHGK